MTVGLFEVATDSDDAHRRTAARMQDKIAQATYDVRVHHGDWLFGAKDLQGFHDRVAMSFNSICRTIEPTLHARKGVSSRVIKNLEQEWRQRQACYPGCEKNEAHAAKFHKDKGEDKEARRRQAAEDGAYERSQPDHPEMHTQQTFQDHQGEDLIPEGDFHAYQDRVDQGGPEKVDSHDFIEPQTDTGVAKSRQHDESDSDNFVPTVTGSREHQYLAGLLHQAVGSPAAPLSPQATPDLAGEYNEAGSMAKSQAGPPNIGGLMGASGGPGSMDTGMGDVSESTPGGEKPGSSVTPMPLAASREFAHLARFLYADDMTGNDPNAQVGGGAMGTAGAAPMPAAPAGGTAPPTTPPPAAAGGAAGLAAPPPGGPPMVASREFQVMAKMLHADMPGSAVYPGGATPPGTGEWNKGDDFTLKNVENGGGASWATSPAAPHEAARTWALKVIQREGTLSARRRLLEAARNAGVIAPIDYRRIAAIYRNKVADRNYLQQADEALTKVLNEKAEEFQNTIAPLQQALVTIQQAEQLQNPLNVQSPAGTVNVLPQGGQDPNAAAGAAPAGGGQAPQGAGGLGADPAAAALAGQAPPQQMQASWYTGVQTRPRQAGRRQAFDLGSEIDQNACAKCGTDIEGPNHRGGFHDRGGNESCPQGGRHAMPNRQDDSTMAGRDPRDTYRGAARGRRPLADRRQADVGDAWNQWSQEHTNRGDDSTYEQFAQDKGYAAPTDPRAKAIPSLQNGGVGGAPKTPSGGANRGMPKKPKGVPGVPKPPKPAKGPGYGIAAQRRQADAAPEPGYVWSKAPASVKGEFVNRVGSGITPEAAFKQMIAEITEHHAKGVIGSHDAHRAANEAFGRLLLSRRGRRPLGVGGR